MEFILTGLKIFACIVTIFPLQDWAKLTVDKLTIYFDMKQVIFPTID